MKIFWNNIKEIFNWFTYKKFKKKQLEINEQQLISKLKHSGLNEIGRLTRALNTCLEFKKEPSSVDFAMEFNSMCLVLLENIVINLKILENNQIIINMFPLNIAKTTENILKKIKLLSKNKDLVYDTDLINSKKMYYECDINLLPLILSNIIIEIINNSKEEKIQIFTHQNQEDYSSIQVVFILYASTAFDSNAAGQELESIISYIQNTNNLNKHFDDNTNLRIYVANKLIKALNQESKSLMPQQLNIQKIKDHDVYWFKIPLKKLYCYNHSQILPHFYSKTTHLSESQASCSYYTDEKEKTTYLNNKASSYTESIGSKLGFIPNWCNH